MMLSFTDIKQALGDQADNLLNFKTPKIAKERLQVPRKGFVKEVFGMSNRSAATQKAMQEMFDHGNLGGTGYVSILPVDQGIEHSGGASFLSAGPGGRSRRANRCPSRGPDRWRKMRACSPCSEAT
jgi:class I fructose-bisphosphate aldolase